MTNEELLHKYAQSYAQDEIIWELCNELDWPDALRNFYRAHGEATKSILREMRDGGDTSVMDLSISGYSDRTPHRDIDKDLKMKFGSRVSVDSESGQFFAYCNNSVENEVHDFLTETYPDLDFNIKKRNSKDLLVSNIYNWGAAQRFCEENGIEIPNPLPKKIQVLAEGYKNKIQKMEEDLEDLKEERIEKISNLINQ
jgi:hypothetical protein